MPPRQTLTKSNKPESTSYSDRMTQATTQRPRKRSRLKTWQTVLTTGNPPPGTIDIVSRWLVLTRAAIAPITLTAAAIAGLLAVGHPDVNWLWFALAAIGILLAHAANNLMNDLADTKVGTDEAAYPRALYAPHPILSGMITKAGLITAALVLNSLDLGIMVVLTLARGWPIVAFAVAGFLLSYAYTAPPLRLKRIGLGELDVLIVWGPLMVGGCYYAATGEITWGVIAASLPYSILCVTVLMGKHIDKIAWDKPLGTKTLPVVLGERLARRWTQAMMLLFYFAVVACVVAGFLPWPTLLVLVATKRLAFVWQYFAAPRPAERPDHRFTPVWPLWFAPIAFYHLRRVSWLYILGLGVGVFAFGGLYV